VRLRRLQGYGASRVIVYVERNLGFEAEHHQRALASIPVRWACLDSIFFRYRRVGLCSLDIFSFFTQLTRVSPNRTPPFTATTSTTGTACRPPTPPSTPCAS